MKCFSMLVLLVLCSACSISNQDSLKADVDVKVAGSLGVNSDIDISGVIDIPENIGDVGNKKVSIKGVVKGSVLSSPHPSKEGWSVISSEWHVDATTTDGKNKLVKLDLKYTTAYSGHPSEGFKLSYSQLWQAISSQIKSAEKPIEK